MPTPIHTQLDIGSQVHQTDYSKRFDFFRLTSNSRTKSHQISAIAMRVFRDVRLSGQLEKQLAL
jgi:hypothetical protein